MLQSFETRFIHLICIAQEIKEWAKKFDWSMIIKVDKAQVQDAHDIARCCVLFMSSIVF